MIRFALKGTLLYFTGTLLLPVTSPMISAIKEDIARVSVYAMRGVYIILPLWNVACTTLTLHEYWFRRKIQACHALDRTLEKLPSPIVQGKCTTLKDVLSPYVFCQCKHAEIGNLREYPFEFRTFIQLCATILIPIAVVAIDDMLRQGGP